MTASQKSSSQTIVNHYAKQGQHRLIRTGNLFVIHCTEAMFFDNGCGNVYFHQCLQTYINILKQKLSHNKDDYMGLMLCNTSQSDDDTENILTIQKLDKCTTSMYMELMKLYDKDIVDFKNQISHTDCSIANVLLHAARVYDALTPTTVTRNVIFLTCDDNPAPDDSKERHRIRLNAKNYKDINIKLNIIGLGENWDYDIFYKEIEMLAEKTAGRNFKRMNLADLEQEIIFKPHILASLEFRMRSNAKIKVSLQGFLTNRKKIHTKSMGKDTNEPLDTYTWYSYEPANEDAEIHIHDNTPEDVMKMQRFGNRDIVFTNNEVRAIHTLSQPGIDLLGFKQKPNEDPTYQIQPVIFMGCHVGSNAGELKFFTALLSKMAKANLMAICTLTFRLNARPRLCMMWPSLELGGFYLIRMPYKEDVRINLSSITEKYVFNETDNIAPTNEEQLHVMRSIVQSLYVEKYPIDFINNRLQRLLKSVEAVALELPPVDHPQDNTLPDFDSMRDKLNKTNLIELYHNTFDEIDESARVQSAKVRKLDDEYVNNAMKEGNFNKHTAVILKSILRTLGQSSTGNKAELINKLNDYKKQHF